jgi:LPXTG-motif cell wall-anchored protein
MSSLRRIVAAGLPTAGLTVLTALAISGAPAMAATSVQAVRPAVAATPCADADRANCGYGATETPDSPGAGPATTTPTRGKPGYGSPAPTTTAPATTPATTTPGTTPATTPATTGPTPTASTDTVPPGVNNSSETPSTPGAATTTPGGGVSAGHNLPVTGAPMGAVISLGILLVAAGGASVWYTRRRRSAA